MAMGSVNEQNQIHRQMGCLAGFLQLFDRHHTLTGKRLYSTKRLPSSGVVDMASDLEISAPSMPKSGGGKSPCKFYSDSPRLSLDSRATMDAKGGFHPKEIRSSAAVLSDGFQQQSPCVIARLMGLEAPPPGQKPELRRSASESRASRDLFRSRFVAEGRSMSNSPLTEDSVKGNGGLNTEYEDPIRDRSWRHQANNAALCKGSNRIGSRSAQPPWKASPHGKWLFESGDIFPDPKQAPSIHGEIGKRLKTGVVHESSKDLETLKQILEALQLKGLLHSSCPNQTSRRVFVYDESPIVLIRPSKFSNSTLSMTNPGYIGDRSLVSGGNRDRSVRRHCSFAGENSNPRLERYVSSPTSTRGRKYSVNPKPTSAGIQKRPHEPMQNRRVAANQSPIRKPRRIVPDQPANSGSHRSKKTADKAQHREKITTTIVVDDESSSTSGSSGVTTSTDTERSKSAGYKQGKNLLETDAQPSPVSVLDSSFYKDEALTPSPVETKRNLDLKDECPDLVEVLCRPAVSPIRSKCGEIVDDSDFLYIWDILRASGCLSEESDVFLLLEKQQYLEGKDTSQVSRLQRKLIFDTTTEFLDRNRKFPPWKSPSWDYHNVNKTLLNKVWSELERIREPNTAQDLLGVICGVLKKDLSAAGDSNTGWADWPAEELGAVLDMERMIFKDLIGETVQDLETLACRSSSMSYPKPRRKLVFSI